MGKLWRGFDHHNRELATGFIDARGKACFFEGQSGIRIYALKGSEIPAHEILEDVDNQIAILQLPK